MITLSLLAQSALAQSFAWAPPCLLGQTGIAKSMVAWVLVILCVLLGALPLVQPYGRKAPPKPE